MGRRACHEVHKVAPIDSDSVAIAEDDTTDSDTDFTIASHAHGVPTYSDDVDGDLITAGVPAAATIGTVTLDVKSTPSLDNNSADSIATINTSANVAPGDNSNGLCLCLPGTTIPCTLGRSHLNRKDLKDNFTAHFESIRYEVVTVGKTTRSINRFGCCPLCKKELVVATKLTKPSYFKEMKNVNLFVKHMNLVHGAGMAELVDAKA